MYASERWVATSVLVIGAGGSGLRATIELAEPRVDVLGVGTRPKTDAHTSLEACGIDAALATTDPEDTWQQHAADMLKASGILYPENAAGTLVSETVREIGILRNGLGRRFMSRYDPEHMEVSTRDRVALAPYTEIKEGCGCHNRSDYPDLDHALQVNPVWSGPGPVEREAIPSIPDDIAALLREVSTAGKPVD